MSSLATTRLARDSTERGDPLISQLADDSDAIDALGLDDIL